MGLFLYARSLGAQVNRNQSTALLWMGGAGCERPLSANDQSFEVFANSIFHCCDTVKACCLLPQVADIVDLRVIKRRVEFALKRCVAGGVVARQGKGVECRSFGIQFGLELNVGRSDWFGAPA